MIRFKHKGDFKKTERFLKRAGQLSTPYDVIALYAQKGVEALASATPERSGKTAASWGYEFAETDDGFSIFWTNSNINEGVNIAVILQYGHGTGWGAYVEGVDYINPSIKSVFDEIAAGLCKEVTSA